MSKDANRDGPLAEVRDRDVFPEDAVAHFAHDRLYFELSSLYHGWLSEELPFGF